MRIGLGYGKGVFITGVAGYGRMLRPALAARGHDVDFVFLTRRDWKLFGRPVGGYASMWVERLRWRRPPGYDIVHALDTVMATRRTDVATVHDLVVEDFPEWYQRGIGGKLEWRFTKRLLLQVPWMQSQSDTTRAEVIRRWGRDPETIVTVYQSYNRDAYQPTPGGHPLLAPDRPNFVFVGDDNPRKNLVLAIRALGELQRTRGVRPRFIRVGALRWPEVQELMLAEAKRLDVDLVQPGALPDEEVAKLYSGASGFLWPSLAEGWGIPPVEAMSCGCPVVANDLPINREVLGDLVFYHGNDPASMAAALDRCLGSSPPRDQLNRHANRYTWEGCAKGLEGIYERALRR